MNQSKIKASSMKTILASLIVIIILFMLGIVYLSNNWLREYASTINVVSINTATSIDATSSDQVEDALDNESSIVEKSKGLTFASQNYLSQASTDINYYANKYSVSIASINEDTSSLGASISNLSTKNLSISFNNPISYVNFVEFLKSIENSSPKMQTTSLDISRSLDTNGYISISKMTIRIYVK